MATALNAAIQATVYFRYKANGWSEKYWLKTTDLDQADLDLVTLCQYRRAFMGNGVEIIWARTSQAGKPRDSVSLESIPLGWLPSMKKAPTDSDELYRPSDPSLAIVYRMETVDRLWQNRIFRGVPDALIYDFKVVGTQPLPLPAGTTLVPPGNPADASADLYRSSFLSWLLGNTQMLTPSAPGVTPKTWLPRLFKKFKPHQIGRHKTGKPFGVSAGRALS